MSELVFSKFKKITQSFLFLPHFISWVVVGAFAYNIFNYEYGIVNNILTSLGGKPIDIYSTPQVWPALIGTYICGKQMLWFYFVLISYMGIDMRYNECCYN
jgi:putative aldouronate transport system permease protein